MNRLRFGYLDHRCTSSLIIKVDVGSATVSLPQRPKVFHIVSNGVYTVYGIRYAVYGICALDVYCACQSLSQNDSTLQLQMILHWCTRHLILYGDEQSRFVCGILDRICGLSRNCILKLRNAERMKYQKKILNATKIR